LIDLTNTKWQMTFPEFVSVLKIILNSSGIREFR